MKVRLLIEKKIVEKKKKCSAVRNYAIDFIILSVPPHILSHIFCDFFRLFVSHYILCFPFLLHRFHNWILQHDGASHRKDRACEKLKPFNDRDRLRKFEIEISCVPSSPTYQLLLVKCSPCGCTSSLSSYHIPHLLHGSSRENSTKSRRDSTIRVSVFCFTVFGLLCFTR